MKKRGIYRNAPKKGELRGKFTVYTCKTCGQEFRRRSWGHSSREYCTYTCEPAFLMRRCMEYRESLASISRGMQVCSDVAFYERLHSYQQKRNATLLQFVQESLPHYPLPHIQYTEKQLRQQTIMAYLGALATTDFNP